MGPSARVVNVAGRARLPEIVYQSIPFIRAHRVASAMGKVAGLDTNKAADSPSDADRRSTMLEWFNLMWRDVVCKWSRSACPMVLKSFASDLRYL